jgi:hypothetical protein
MVRARLTLERAGGRSRLFDVICRATVLRLIPRIAFGALAWRIGFDLVVEFWVGKVDAYLAMDGRNPVLSSAFPSYITFQ